MSIFLFLSSSFLLLRRRQNNVSILPGQIEHIVCGGLWAPAPRSSQRPDSGQIPAGFTFPFRGASLEWLCLLRAWCGVSIARCLGVFVVPCLQLEFLPGWNPVDRSSPQGSFLPHQVTLPDPRRLNITTPTLYTIVFFPRSPGWGK